MIEIRFHGRGGQGAVTSAEILAVSAINEGKYAQAFPSFGPERRGAPVIAFCRIDDHPIKIRANIYEPDIILVLDASLPELIDVTYGLKKGGILVSNFKHEIEKAREHLKTKEKIGVVNASKIAMEELKLPITNTTMLGALLKASQLVENSSVIDALKERFGKVADRNIHAFERAYKETVIINGSP
ncbi:MAG: pyruvate synthase [Deltaproteobacteria bacterium]|nr:2-oxoacid:acceptor oxidoreductase family protein [Deltaproteobacteria bacterium]RLA89480.1 MAG: pyruvate synthase [Deltaproteobacteria bacterium]